MIKLEHITIHKNKTLLEGLELLNKILYVENISRLILFVIDDNKAVIGTITDGDIRRALVKSKSLDVKIGTICNKDFHFEWYTNGYIDLSKYRKIDIKIIPLLNKEKCLVDIIDVSKQQASLPLECVIMAGGRGKRLSPFTDSLPKPMLPLGDKTIIEHNIDRLISFGIKKIYISINYLGEIIEANFGDGSSKGIDIEYIREDEPLGTAGALTLVDNYKSEHLLLMNSDLFTDVNFEDLYLDLVNNNADMVVASTQYKVDVPFAIFETEARQVKSFKEKPSYIYHSNAGIYMFKTALISKIPKNQFYNITDLMEELVNEGAKLIHNPILGYWMDIGTPSDYKRAQEFIKHFS
ncbi:nucleotidyltransferase family protein [Flavobacterium tibetense]|uniref:Nucleotidyltransferase n=1 Tax=Flavobacterium tibetense TaxID=2233533 RepID=A0A365P3Y0_9FLAO|nr:nucleotidyltransferase family protein [Flavobacterium tibetense]RBA29130.1 nucleotidyltransferase [Flavobacterium tibetense]